MIDLARLIEYDNGRLDNPKTIELFQELISTGLVWKMKEEYRLTATDLIEDGHCQMPHPSTDDYDTDDEPYWIKSDSKIYDED